MITAKQQLTVLLPNEINYGHTIDEAEKVDAISNAMERYAEYMMKCEGLAKIEDFQIVVDKAQLEALLLQNEAYKKDIVELVDIIKQILQVVGLLDETGVLKAEIKSGEDSAMKHILKSLSGIIMTSMVQPKKIDEKFGFVARCYPIYERHKDTK